MKKILVLFNHTALVVQIWVLSVCALAAQDYTVYADVADSELKTLAFGVGDLQASLADAGDTSSIKALNQLTNDPQSSFVFAYADDAGVINNLTNSGGSAPGSLSDNGFAIRVTNSGSSKTYWCFGDRIGLMYAAFELTELVKNGDLGTVADGDHNPFLEKRGLKMNIPLDARTPSYADWGTAAQENIEEMWSMDFWQAQLDGMARNRYNCYTLWSLQPFPSLVRTPGYEEVALDDVMRGNVDVADRNEGYSTKGLDMVDEDLLNNLVTVKKMTIDEKMQFWRDVMQYGHDRGIEFHLYTWNVFVYGTHARDDITETMDNNTTKDYMRKSVRELFKVYPLLAGIGVTAGENMAHDGQATNKATDEEKEQWLWDTYGRGVQDALSDDTSRHIRFVHRGHQADEELMNAYFGDLITHPRVIFDLSTKYAKAHMYSYAGPGQEQNSIEDEIPGDGKWWLNLRNDSIFSFRWGDYDFVQTFVKYLTPDLDIVRGFHMGSDGYVWGREFADKDPDFPRQIEHDKHWLKFMLWGRLGFDPDTPESRFADEATRRLDISNADVLMATWKTASKIIPAVNREHYYGLDYQWHPEYNHDRRPERWHGLVGETAWIKRADSGYLTVADELLADAQAVLDALPALRAAASGRDYVKTLNDLECFAHLGNFYGERMLAAYHLDKGDETAARPHTIAGAEHWKQYATLASSMYIDQVLGRVRPLSWLDLYQNALDDIPGGHDLNQLPTVSFSSPNNGAFFFPAPADVAVTVDASDPDGSVSHVELRLNGSVVASDDSAPYEFALDDLPLGEHMLEARAADNDGDWQASVITIGVRADAGVALESLPWIEDFNQADGAKSDNDTTSWTASRADGEFEIQGNRLWLNGGGPEGVLKTGLIDISDGSVDVSVDVESVGGLEIDEEYVRLYVSVDGGGEVLLEEVWGEQTGTTLSGTVDSGSILQVIVRADVSSSKENYYIDNLRIEANGEHTNKAPDVMFDQPADGADFEEGEAISVRVLATDSDGDIDRVELTQNGVPLATENGSSYTWTLSGLSPGSYELIATAYDDEDQPGSATITITVSAVVPDERTIAIQLNQGAPLIGQEIAVSQGDPIMVVATDSAGSAQATGLALNDTELNFVEESVVVRSAP